jgi:hypothetical protein
MPKKRSVGHDEHWMEAHLPQQLAGKFYKGFPDGQTLRSGPEVYQVLNPLGIVVRDYPIGYCSIRSTVIASDSRQSFHDPFVCLPGHGLDLDASEPVTVQTARGEIVGTLVQGQEDPQAAGQSGSPIKWLAVFFYKGPDGFCPSTLRIKLQLLDHLLLHPFDNVTGVFYEFLVQDQSMEINHRQFTEGVLRSIGAYMDAAADCSKGYF